MLREGRGIIEAFEIPLTDAQGLEVKCLDSPSITAHFRNTMDDLIERRRRSDELCDLRKLKLQQILQLKSCEKDTDQVFI